VAQDQTFYGWMTPRTLGRFVRGFYPTWDDASYTNLLKRMDLPGDRRVGTFSGGMKAKVALALALAHSPKLLVLDEPTAGLDPVARREFLEMIRDEAARTGATTFFSTHLIDEIDVAANRVGIVDDGVTRYEGTVSDLMARHRLVALVDPGDAWPMPPALTDPNAFRVVARRWQGTEKRMLVEAADPASWNHVDVRPWRIEALPLEELFIEMVRRAM
jgi:ABC-2 type transport system ATP-binding protein